MAWLEARHTVRGDRRTHRLVKPVTTLGRARGNDVVLDDPSLDESHASVLRQGKDWSIAASSRGATVVVGGKRVRRAAFTADTEVLLGAWRVVFHEGEPEAEITEDAVALSLLEQLVTLSTDMMRDTTPRRLFTTLLQGLVQVTHAEKGFIILFQDGERHLAAAHNVGGEALDLSRVSDSIVDRVVDGLKPLIVSDAMHDSRFGRAKSVVDLQLSSVMCVPMIHQNDLLGVIYLGNDAVQDLFTERDLTILTIYAAQASTVVSHALLLEQLKLDNHVLRNRLDQADHGEMIGNSAPMRQVYRTVQKVAPTDLSVLILGETGTGKELVARELHARSDRGQGPFVAINCGAIPENLLESELFGHAKGAFTGADTDKIGRIEASHGGTLFLDEIGEMPTNLQVKLLRVLQERQIERVGDVKPRPVELRVVAATNRHPKDMIKAGTFREDLFYRLDEVTIELPALRDRGDDIELLAHHFLEVFRAQYDAKAKGFTNQAVLALKAHDWPGNVRELRSAVKKGVIMADRALLNADDLGITSTAKRHVVALADAQEQFKVDYIKSVLDLNNWNKAQTARDLGVDARTIFRYIDKIEVDEP